MVKSLRLKILFSFLLLILMLVLAGVMSIWEFHRMGDSVDKVMTNNYQSIESSKIMLDAVERQDSHALMWMLGDTSEGENGIQQSDSAMHSALIKTRNNITEKDEATYIAKIEEEYTLFHEAIKKIIVSPNTETGKKIYYTEVKLHFQATKKAISELMLINQDGMYKQSSIVREKSKRAMMPAIVSIVAAVIFAILLNFFIAIYFINPINRLIQGVKTYYHEQGRINTKIKSQDELKTLEDEINNMIYRLSRKQNISSSYNEN